MPSALFPPRTPAGDEPLAVLVVEDEPAISLLLQRVLERAGFPVLVAHDAVTALERLRANPAQFGLVVLDLLIPGGGGTAFRSLQRMDPALASVPVLIVSGAGREGALAAIPGVAGFVEKPFPLALLVAMVRRHSRRQLPPLRAAG